MQNSIQQKSFSEHLDFLFQLSKLSLWFSWRWQKEHPEEKLTQIIQNRSHLSQTTGLLDKKEEGANTQIWKDLMENVEAIFAKVETVVEFERECFAIFKPVIKLHAPENYKESIKPVVLPCGSLWYDPPPEKMPHCATFHIKNAIQPRSIFENAQYLPQCLISLMDKVEKEFGATAVSVCTWLNSYPRWLALFPEEFKENHGKFIQTKGGIANWGQLINARGLFNDKVATIVRETGNLPFRMVWNYCSIEALRKHIKDNFS